MNYLRDSRGVSWNTEKSAFMFQWKGSDSRNIMQYMLALVGQPSLRGRDACIVLRVWGRREREGEGGRMICPFFNRK